MKKFLDENFLLETKTAEDLYHQHAAGMPIIDYHCHLSPAQIADNRNFENITQPWLYGDHYKWRAMRTNGIDEKYCSGNASDREKFMKWAETVPYTLRNPLYHWTHLELQRYFGISDLLNPETAGDIYTISAGMLKQKEFTPAGLIKMMNVELVCTTDDPVDTLGHHRKIRETMPGIKVIPAWRPDKIMSVDNPSGFNAYVNKLSAESGVEIKNYETLLAALENRHRFFHDEGCRLSDHGLDVFYADDYTLSEINAILTKVRNGLVPTHTEISKFRSAVLYDLALLDHKRNWTQQFHVGAMRNNNSKMMRAYGPDGGFDSIGDYRYASSMSRFLDRLDSENKLSRTILYNLNPSDNEILATMIGNFQNSTMPGKIQWGSAWWFLDQKDGMEKHINALSNLGLLSRFVGMLTDSRSLLSFPRHEYFRRVLCNLIGNDVEKGLLPNDLKWLGKMVEDICYHNAKNYFNFM